MLDISLYIPTLVLSLIAYLANTHKHTMTYAIKRHDGKLFPERFTTRATAEKELQFKLGNCATYGLAWIVEII